MSPGLRTERADAARNRLAILAAAERLLHERGAEEMTMDQLACAAGVGKGTLFRRFGDRASLFHALLDERERALQERFIRGPAPLGPGGSPRERLVAYGREILDFIEEQHGLLLAAETGLLGGRLRHPVYGAHRAHVSALLGEAGYEAEQADYLADVLLAALAPPLIVHQRGVLGRSAAQLAHSWEQLVARLVD
jgi:AcrR family transcriptional regulator